MTSDVYAAQPEPPVNVRIQYMDGSEDPVELTYGGQDADGTHVWEAAPLRPLVSLYASIRADMIPPNTTIKLTLVAFEN